MLPRSSVPLLTAKAGALCLALLFATAATAQQASARIVGTITDQQGAVIPGVKVIAINTATNVTNETITDKSGYYQVLNLPIGTYRVVARHQDFRPMEVLTAPLEINQSLRVDLRLEVGPVNQEVLVEGQATGVETINPTLGQSITSRPIINMPLNGRNVLSLALLQPGVTDDNPDDTSASQGFNIAGGRTDSVTYLLDGGVNNDLIDNGVVFNPNPDSVAEFRILTSNYTAEYGRNGAGVISVVTKSGTNQFHGSAFEFLRNTDFDANSYFNIQADLPRNNLKRSQFGGTFGGPLIKNRLFFFTSYQGQRQVQTDVLPEQQTFTTLELGGNFSQAANGGPDPNVVAFLQANPYFQSNPALAAQAIIDPTKFDPAAQAYINAKLVNGQPMIPSNATGEFFPSGSSTDNANELTVKIDFDINAKDKLSATVGGNRNPVLSPFGGFGFSTAPGFPSTTQNNTDFLNIAYTRSFSPTMQNELRGTAQRRSNLQDQPVSSFTPIPQFGIASDISTGPPLMEFDNGLAFGQDPYGPTTFAGNTFAIADSFTWVRGHHTWNFGAGISAYQQNTLYAFFTDGLFSFAGFADGGDGTGNSLADFLVGAPNNLFEGPDAANNIRSKTTYGFVQDEWRARTNLTLTLGIRYEYSTPKLDTGGRTFSIIPGDQSVKFPNAPLGLVFPGDPGAPRGVNFPDKKNFAPRIGFAWSPGSNSKTSIRGGFGVFYDVLKGEDNLQFNGAPPFYSEPYVVFPCLASAADPTCTSAPYTSATPFYGAPWANSTTPFAGNPFPSKPPDPATAFNTCANAGYTCPYYNFLPAAGGSVYFVNPHLHTPYIYQYNLSVQHEVASNLIAEVNYVGSSSKGLTSLVDINPFDLSTISGPNPARILNEQQNANITAYCAFQGGPSDCPFENADEFGNVAFANFNSLETSLTKQNGANRIIGNTYFTLAYTYGHSIDNASGFRNRDSQVPYYEPGVFRASSDFDVRQRITFSGGWDLPLDRAWASGPKRLLKGWSLYPIFSWRTGFPLSINSELIDSFSPSDPGPSGAGDGYLANADYAPGFSKITILNPKKQASCSNPNTGLTDTGNLYFNCGAFVAIPDVPGSGYGTTGRDFFRGPGRTNLDLALAKTTTIAEQMNLEFRVEAFNMFNHTEFANPDTNLDDATFGQITSTTLGSGITALQTQRIVQLAARLTF
jgi:Carboxypeptidase regulatory-like domain